MSIWTKGTKTLVQPPDTPNSIKQNHSINHATAAVTMACTHPIPKDERESARTGQQVSERLRPAHQNTKSPNQPLDTSNSIDQDNQKLKRSIEQQNAINTIKKNAQNKC